MKYLGKKDDILVLQFSELEIAALGAGMRETLEVWDQEYETRTGFSRAEFKNFESNLMKLVDEIG